MAIGHKFMNIDEYFRECENAVILNNLKGGDQEQIEETMKMVRTIHDGEFLSNVASCSCGKLTGNYRIGETCSDCKTNNVLDKGKYDPDLWCIKLTDTPFIAPMFWMLFNGVISNSIDTLLYLSDVNYKHTAKIEPAVMKLAKSNGFGRNYKFVINNMEFILEFLANTLPVKKREEMEDIRRIYIRDKSIIYSTYLPMFTKKIFITEVNGSYKITQKSIATPITNVLRFMKQANLKETDLENELIMAKTIASMVATADTFFRESLTGKPGGMRTKEHAIKAPFSGRCVGTSIVKSHDMEVCELPWSVGVTLFRAQLVGRLVRKLGYSLKDAKILITESIQNYSQVLGDLMQEIIDESPYDGYPLMVVRNPTLLPSSLLFLRFKTVKKDTTDTTISLSVLLMTFLAGDFDGDEYSFGLLLDEFMASGFQNLEPSRTVMSYDKVAEVNDVITITKASATAISNFINKNKIKEDHVEVVKNVLFTMR